MQNTTGINAMAACAPSREPCLGEMISNNCDKAQQARDMAYRIASNLFTQIPCEASKTTAATCTIEKAIEESLALEELIHTLGRIIERL
jgi:hypothetical protein